MKASAGSWQPGYALALADIAGSEASVEGTAEFRRTLFGSRACVAISRLFHADTRASLCVTESASVMDPNTTALS